MIKKICVLTALAVALFMVPGDLMTAQKMFEDDGYMGRYGGPPSGWQPPQQQQPPQPTTSSPSPTSNPTTTTPPPAPNPTANNNNNNNNNNTNTTQTPQPPRTQTTWITTSFLTGGGGYTFWWTESYMTVITNNTVPTGGGGGSQPPTTHGAAGTGSGTGGGGTGSGTGGGTTGGTTSGGDRTYYSTYYSYSVVSTWTGGQYGWWVTFTTSWPYRIETITRLRPSDTSTTSESGWDSRYTPGASGQTADGVINHYTNNGTIDIDGLMSHVENTGDLKLAFEVLDSLRQNHGVNIRPILDSHWSKGFLQNVERWAYNTGHTGVTWQTILAACRGREPGYDPIGWDDTARGVIQHYTNGSNIDYRGLGYYIRDACQNNIQRAVEIFEDLWNNYSQSDLRDLLNNIHDRTLLGRIKNSTGGGIAEAIQDRMDALGSSTEGVVTLAFNRHPGDINAICNDIVDAMVSTNDMGYNASILLEVADKGGSAYVNGILSRLLSRIGSGDTGKDVFRRTWVRVCNGGGGASKGVVKGALEHYILNVLHTTLPDSGDPTDAHVNGNPNADRTKPAGCVDYYGSDYAGLANYITGQSPAFCASVLGELLGKRGSGVVIETLKHINNVGFLRNVKDADNASVEVKRLVDGRICQLTGEHSCFGTALGIISYFGDNYEGMAHHLRSALNVQLTVDVLETLIAGRGRGAAASVISYINNSAHLSDVYYSTGDADIRQMIIDKIGDLGDDLGNNYVNEHRKTDGSGSIDYDAIAGDMAAHNDFQYNADVLSICLSFEKRQNDPTYQEILNGILSAYSRIISGQPNNIKLDIYTRTYLAVFNSGMGDSNKQMVLGALRGYITQLGGTVPTPGTGTRLPNPDPEVSADTPDGFIRHYGNDLRALSNALREKSVDFALDVLKILNESYGGIPTVAEVAGYTWLSTNVDFLRELLAAAEEAGQTAIADVIKARIAYWSQNPSGLDTAEAFIGYYRQDYLRMAHHLRLTGNADLAVEVLEMLYANYGESAVSAVLNNLSDRLLLQRIADKTSNAVILRKLNERLGGINQETNAFIEALLKDWYDGKENPRPNYSQAASNLGGHNDFQYTADMLITLLQLDISQFRGAPGNRELVSGVFSAWLPPRGNTAYLDILSRLWTCVHNGSGIDGGDKAFLQGLIEAAIRAGGGSVPDPTGLRQIRGNPDADRNTVDGMIDYYGSNYSGLAGDLAGRDARFAAQVLEKLLDMRGSTAVTAVLNNYGENRLQFLRDVRGRASSDALKSALDGKIGALTGDRSSLKTAESVLAFYGENYMGIAHFIRDACQNNTALALDILSTLKNEIGNSAAMEVINNISDSQLLQKLMNAASDGDLARMLEERAASIYQQQEGQLKLKIQNKDWVYVAGNLAENNDPAYNADILAMILRMFGTGDISAFMGRWGPLVGNNVDILNRTLIAVYAKSNISDSDKAAIAGMLRGYGATADPMPTIGQDTSADVTTVTGMLAFYGSNYSAIGHALDEKADVLFTVGVLEQCLRTRGRAALGSILYNMRHTDLLRSVYGIANENVKLAVADRLTGLGQGINPGYQDSVDLITAIPEEGDSSVPADTAAGVIRHFGRDFGAIASHLSGSSAALAAQTLELIMEFEGSGSVKQILEAMLPDPRSATQGEYDAFMRRYDLLVDVANSTQNLPLYQAIVQRIEAAVAQAERVFGQGVAAGEGGEGGEAVDPTPQDVIEYFGSDYEGIGQYVWGNGDPTFAVNTLMLLDGGGMQKAVEAILSSEFLRSMLEKASDSGLRGMIEARIPIVEEMEHQAAVPIDFDEIAGDMFKRGDYTYNAQILAEYIADHEYGVSGMEKCWMILEKYLELFDNDSKKVEVLIRTWEAVNFEGSIPDGRKIAILNLLEINVRILGAEPPMRDITMFGGNPDADPSTSDGVIEYFGEAYYEMARFLKLNRNTDITVKTLEKLSELRNLSAVSSVIGNISDVKFLLRILEQTTVAGVRDLITDRITSVKQFQNQLIATFSFEDGTLHYSAIAQDMFERWDFYYAADVLTLLFKHGKNRDEGLDYVKGLLDSFTMFMKPEEAPDFLARTWVAVHNSLNLTGSQKSAMEEILGSYINKFRWEPDQEMIGQALDYFGEDYQSMAGYIMQTANSAYVSGVFDALYNDRGEEALRSVMEYIGDDGFLVAVMYQTQNQGASDLVRERVEWVNLNLYNQE
ncbi:MAG: hypothetical protein JW803_00435 [Endomicrobiales bacterium]|nr:hypothetical protein [Endomicrobiales bacterium]